MSLDLDDYLHHLYTSIHPLLLCQYLYTKSWRMQAEVVAVRRRVDVYTKMKIEKNHVWFDSDSERHNWDDLSRRANVKQVSIDRNDFFCVRIRTFILHRLYTTSSVYRALTLMKRHLRLSLRSSNRSRSRRVCAGTFQTNCNYSFVNTRSAQIKAEKRRSELKLLDLEKKPKKILIGDSTMQKQADYSLSLGSGLQEEYSESNTLLWAGPGRCSRLSPWFNHPDEAAIGWKTGCLRYQVAMMLQMSGQQKLLAENSSLRRENQWLRGQLVRQAWLPLHQIAWSSVLSLSPKLALLFPRGNDATFPLDSTNSFSSMIKSWEETPKGRRPEAPDRHSKWLSVIYHAQNMLYDINPTRLLFTLRR